MLTLYDDRRSPIGVLPQAKNIHRTQNVSGTDTLEFDYPLFYLLDGKEVSDEIAKQIKNQYFIYTADQVYVIKETNPNDGVLSVLGTVYVDELTNAINLAFARPDEYLHVLAENALIGTSWTFETNIPNVQRSLEMKQSTALDIMKKLAELFMTDLQFDAKNKIVYLNQEVSENKGVIFDDKLNLLNIQIKRDTHDLITRLIPVGKDNLYITEVNGGLNYVENYQYTTQNITAFWAAGQYTSANALKEDAIKKLDILSQPKTSFSCSVIDMARLAELYSELGNYSEYSYSLGDNVTIKDRITQSYQVVRIVEMVTYPEEPENNTLQLDSEYALMEDYFERVTKVDEQLSSLTTASGDQVDGDKIDEISGEKVDSIEWAKVKNVQIETTQIKDAQITSAKIGDAAITTAKIEDLTITTAKIGDLQVTNEKVNSLSADKLTTGIIDANVITVKNINASEINAGTLDATQVNVANLSANSINSGIIDASIVTVSNINASNITTGILDAENISVVNLDASAIVTGTFSADRISGGTIDAGVIDVINLDAGKINTGTLNADRIGAGTISAEKMVTGTITAESGIIANAAIDTAQIKALAVTGANIANSTINTANIKSGAITTALIGNQAVNTAQIADGSITNAKIVELSANKITAGTLSVERLEIRGSNSSVVYALNNVTGALQSENVNTLNGEILTDRTITADKIVANEITANEIQTHTITANEIAVGTITAASGIISSLDADVITAGTIDANVINIVNLNADNIVSGSISGDRISGGVITGALLKTSNTTNYIYLHDQYINFYDSNIKRASIGYGTAGPYLNFLTSDSSTVYRVAQLQANQIYSDINNFSRAVTFNEDIQMFSSLKIQNLSSSGATDLDLYGVLTVHGDTVASRGGTIIADSYISASGFRMPSGYADLDGTLYMNGNLISTSGGNITLGSGTITTTGNITAGGYVNLAKRVAYSTTVSISSGSYTTITHNLGYYPIVQLDGSSGNVIVTFNHISVNQLRVNNYSSGGNTYSGTVRLY
ncbi:phage tail spike protein [Clostridium kluyveri]|uniref:phage tail spike protein n=1 Tax=Clostridium kluyveri TaxID=1534 RepID=UPI002247B023|nr:phage tail spike protein [Clostridium kluyveri]UZQ49118.1 phage tail protein [Clostridium kluyveri]